MLIPIFIVRDMAEAIAFHTEVLDFRLAFAWPEEAPIYAGLTYGSDELHLSLASGAGRSGHCGAMVVCDDVDALFAMFRTRGLSASTRPDSHGMKARWTRVGERARSMLMTPAATR